MPLKHEFARDVVSRVERLGKQCRGLASRWPQLAADLLALLTSLKHAVMLDYWFERSQPGEALAAVGQMILELRATYAAGSPEIAELRCVQLGDCVFLLRPSLLRARRDGPPPLFLRLDGQDARRVGPRLADEADTSASQAAWVCVADELLALCERSDYVVAGDATELAAGSVLPSPTLHGLLLGYPVVLLFTLPNGAVALAGLAGAELRVYQLRVDCDTLPDGQAVVCSFSVPAALVPAAQGALDAFDAHAQTCRGEVWTAVQMYSIAQPSHAIVI